MLEKQSAHVNNHPIAISITVAAAFIALSIFNASWWVAIGTGAIGYFIGLKIERA